MRRGAALPAVLLALALTNALVVGAAFVARRQAASARVDAVALPLQPLAERALVRSLVAWDSLDRAEQAVASTVTDPAASDADVTVWITRTSADLYWFVSEARSRSAQHMSRRVGAAVRSASGQPSLVFPRAWAELP